MELARNSASGLRKYFEQFKPAKMVKKQMEMKDLVQCFNLPKKVGGAVLSASSEERKAGTSPERERVSLKLKRGLSQSTLLDLGMHRPHQEPVNSEDIRFMGSGPHVAWMSLNIVVLLFSFFLHPGCALFLVR